MCKNWNNGQAFSRNFFSMENLKHKKMADSESELLVMFSYSIDMNPFFQYPLLHYNLIELVLIWIQFITTLFRTPPSSSCLLFIIPLSLHLKLNWTPRTSFCRIFHLKSFLIESLFNFNSLDSPNLPSLLKRWKFSRDFELGLWTFGWSRSVCFII